MELRHKAAEANDCRVWPRIEIHEDQSLSCLPVLNRGDVSAAGAAATAPATARLPKIKNNLTKTNLRRLRRASDTAALASSDSRHSGILLSRGTKGLFKI